MQDLEKVTTRYDEALKIRPEQLQSDHNIYICAHTDAF